MTTMDRPRITPNPRPGLDEAVNEIAELRPLSAVATQILAITEGDQFCAQELAKVVSADQALAAKMLRLSNSPYYGFPRRIPTVRDAIEPALLRLGLIERTPFGRVISREEVARARLAALAI